MGAKSKIEWTDHTFNPWWGCTKVSPGCAHCYAETFAVRVKGGLWGKDAERRMFPGKHWAEPLKWDRIARDAGRRDKVFCGSMCDLFEGRADLAAARADLFILIDGTPNLDWILCTKRSENIRTMWPGGYFMPHGMGPILTRRPNVWLLTSVENQQTADQRIPELLKCRDLAPVLGLSCEPLLGPIQLDCWSPEEHRRPGRDRTIDWIIVGGESGPKARPMHPDWPRSLRDQCQAAGVPFFFKQWGEWEPMTDAQDWVSCLRDCEDAADARRTCSGVSIIYHDGRIVTPAPKLQAWEDWDDEYEEWLCGVTDDREGPAPVAVHRVGKRTAGRHMDGREWSEFPTGNGQLTTDH